MINISSINQTYYFNSTGKWITRQCTGKEYFSVECLNKLFCPQLTTYFVNVGISLLVLSVVVQWFTWWFFNYGYKNFEYDLTSPLGKYLGDLHKRETRAYWDEFIRQQLIKAFMLFTAVVVYANI